MKIIFVGSVEIGHTVLESIYNTTKSVEVIYTLPLEEKLTTSGFVDFEPIARRYNTKLIRTSNINDEKHINEIRKLAPDLIIICGWQKLICQEIIKIPRCGTVGFHTSLLPKYRGHAPVNWAIIMGEKETGITMFYFTPRADDGDIIAQRDFPILLNDDCNTVYKKAAHAGAEMIKAYLPPIKAGTIRRIHNVSRSYPAYPMRRPVDGLIDFNRSALEVYNFVRGLTKPYPGAFYYDKDGKKIIVWRIEIVFDESRLRFNDIVFDTADMKVRILEWEEGV